MITCCGCGIWAETLRTTWWMYLLATGGLWLVATLHLMVHLISFNFLGYLHFLITFWRRSQTSAYELLANLFIYSFKVNLYVLGQMMPLWGCGARRVPRQSVSSKVSSYNYHVFGICWYGIVYGAVFWSHLVHFIIFNIYSAILLFCLALSRIAVPLLYLFRCIGAS